MSRESEHTCHATGCHAHVDPAMFMCRRHWYVLPKVMRNKIWDAYVPGQETRMDPSPEYLAVSREAIAMVERVEGRR